MVQKRLPDATFRRTGLFDPVEESLARFPIQAVEIDWERLIAKRPTVLQTIDAMPAYLLKPEVLALTPASFIDDGYDCGVLLKQRPGRPSRVALTPSAAGSGAELPVGREIPPDRADLSDGAPDRDPAYWDLNGAGRGAPFAISSHTFRHSLAIHLLQHAGPPKYVSQLLGHQSMDSAEIYTNVLAIDGGHFLDGVALH